MSELQQTTSEAMATATTSHKPIAGLTSTEPVKAFKDDPVKAGEPTGTAATATGAETAAAPVAATAAAGGATAATVSAAHASTEQKTGDSEAKLTAAPVTAGNLAYKAPGLVNQIRAKHYYFWLGSEAIPVSDLGNYLRKNEGDEAKHNAAWSSATGEGLFYYAKREEDKSSPSGVINLSTATEVAKQGTKGFTFLIGKHKHAFEAPEADRNGWVVALESAVEKAKKLSETVPEHATFKESHSSLSKPAVVAGTAAGATAGVAVAGAGAATAHAKESDKALVNEPKEATEPAQSTLAAPADDKNERAKSRSQSRKRQSFFGGLLGKKELDEKEKEDKAAKKDAEEKQKAAKKETEEKQKAAKKEAEKEEKAAKKEAEKVEKQHEKEVKKEEKQHEKEIKKEEKQLEKEVKKEEKHAEGAAAAVVGIAGTSEIAHTIGPDAGTTITEPNVASHDGYVEHKGLKTVEEVAPTTTTAPAVATTTSTTATTPAVTAPTTEASEATGASVGSRKADAATANKTNKRRSLFDIFNNARSASTERYEEEVVAKSKAEKEQAHAATGESAVEEAATTTEAVPAERAAESKRRSSFFGALSGSMKKGPKETSPEPETPVAGTTAATTTTSTTAPVEKVEKADKAEKVEKSEKGGLPAKINDIFRRNSKQHKAGEVKETKKEVNSPTAVTEESVPKLPETTHTTSEPIAPAVAAAPTESSNATAIGDVVPEAITVGQAQSTNAPVQTAA